MTDLTTPDALYDLMSWMSPSWPIGAFSYSSGIEWAVEAGLVHDRESMAAWLADTLDYGSIRTEAIVFAYAHRAAAAGDAEKLATITELAAALLISAERRLESTAQGAAYRRIARSAADRRGGDLLENVEDDDLAYPIAAACHMAAHGIPARSALVAFLHGTVANLVSAAQRLVPLGQTDGQIVIHRLKAAVVACAAEALALPEGSDPFDHIGSATLMAEFAAMAHETQYTRLFRT